MPHPRGHKSPEGARDLGEHRAVIRCPRRRPCQGRPGEGTMDLRTTLLRVAVCAALLPALASPAGAQPAGEASPSRKSLAKGRRLVARAVKAMGGAARIDAVKSLQQAGPIVLKMGEGEMAIPTLGLLSVPAGGNPWP